jgi:hypothetical protein
MTPSGIETTVPQPTGPPRVPTDNYAIIKLILKEATKKKVLTFQTPICVQTYSPKLYVILVALHSTFHLARLFKVGVIFVKYSTVQSLCKLALHVHLCLRITARNN